MSLLRLPDLNPTPPVLIMINHLESHRNLTTLLNQAFARGHSQVPQDPATGLQLGPFPIVSYRSLDQLPSYSNVGQDLRSFSAGSSGSRGDPVFNLITPNTIASMRTIPLGAAYIIEYPAEDPASVLHTYYSSIVVGVQTLMNIFAALGAVPLHIVLVPIPGAQPLAGAAPPTSAAAIVKDFLANLISATRLPANAFINLASPFIDGQALLNNIIAMGRAFFIDLVNEVHAYPRRFAQSNQGASIRERNRICLMTMIRRAFLLSMTSFCDQSLQSIQASQAIATRYSLSSVHTAYLIYTTGERGSPSMPPSTNDVNLHTAVGLANAIVSCYEAALIRLSHHYELLGPSSEVLMLIIAYLRLYGEIQVPSLHREVAKAIQAAQSGKECHLESSSAHRDVHPDFLYPDVETYTYNQHNIIHTPIYVEDSPPNAQPQQPLQSPNMSTNSSAATVSCTPLVFNTFRLAYDTAAPQSLTLLVTIRALFKLLFPDHTEHQLFDFGPKRETLLHMHRFIVCLAQVGLVCEAIRLVSMALGPVDKLVISPNSVQIAEEASALHKELFKATSFISVVGKIFPAEMSKGDTAMLEQATKIRQPEAGRLHCLFPQSSNPMLAMSHRLLTALHWHRKSSVSFNCFTTYLFYITPAAYSTALFSVYSNLLTSLDKLKICMKDSSPVKPPLTAFIGFPNSGYSFEDLIVSSLAKIQAPLHTFFGSTTSDGTTIDTLYNIFIVLTERITRSTFDHASTKQGKLDASERLIQFYTSISNKATSPVASVKLLSYLIYAQLTTTIPLFLNVSSSSLLSKEISALLVDTRKELINPATVYKTLNSCDMDLLRRQLTRRLDFLFDLRDKTSSALNFTDHELLSLLFESFDSYSMALACLEGRAMKSPYSPLFFYMKLLRHEESQGSGVTLNDTDKATLRRLLQDIVTHTAALPKPVVSSSFAYPIIISQLAWNQPSYSVGEAATLAADVELPKSLLEIAASLELDMYILIKGVLSGSPGREFSAQTVIKCKQQNVTNVSLYKMVIPQNYNDNTLKIQAFKVSYIWQKAGAATVNFETTSNQVIDYSSLVSLQARESQFSSVKFYLQRYKENAAETIHKNTYCIVKCSENLCAYVRDPLQMVESGYCLSSPDVYAGKPFVLYLYLKAPVDVPPVTLITAYTCSQEMVQSAQSMLSPQSPQQQQPPSSPLSPRASPYTNEANLVQSSVFIYINGKPNLLTPISPNSVNIGALKAYSVNKNLTFVPFLVCINSACHVRFNFSLQLGTKRVPLAPRHASATPLTLEVAPQGSNHICAVFLRRPVAFVIKTDPVQTLSVSSTNRVLQPLVLSQWTKVEITNETHDDIVITDLMLRNMPMSEILSLSALKDCRVAPGGKMGFIINSRVGKTIETAHRTGLFSISTYYVVPNTGKSTAKPEAMPLCCIQYKGSEHYVPPQLRSTLLDKYINSTEAGGPLLLTGVACHEILTIDVKGALGYPFLILVDEVEGMCARNVPFNYTCELSVQDTNMYTARVRFVQPRPAANSKVAKIPPLEIVSSSPQADRTYTLTPGAKTSVSAVFRSTTAGLCMLPEIHIALSVAGQPEKEWNYVRPARKVFSK